MKSIIIIAILGLGITASAQLNGFKKVRANSIQLLGAFITVDGVPVIADGVDNSIALKDETREAVARFEIQVNYCGYSRLKAEIQPLGPGKSRQVILGGSLSTYISYPMQMGVLVPAGHALPTTDLCRMDSIIFSVNCNIQKRFFGAGCNFNLNDSQSISVEAFRNGMPGALLINEVLN